MDTIKLPAFELLAKQPKIPHVARTVAQNAVPNEHGTPIVFIVSQSRNGRSWWIRAALDGLRMSNTLHTTQVAKAQAWINAVRAGKVSVVEAHTLKCDMTRECAADVKVESGSKFVGGRFWPEYKEVKRGEYGFDREIEARKRKLEGQIASATRHLADLDEKITTWKPVTFPRVVKKAKAS
jgi:hypothetical protein